MLNIIVIQVNCGIHGSERWKYACFGEITLHTSCMCVTILKSWIFLWQFLLLSSLLATGKFGILWVYLLLWALYRMNKLHLHKLKYFCILSVIIVNHYYCAPICLTCNEPGGSTMAIMVCVPVSISHKIRGTTVQLHLHVRRHCADCPSCTKTCKISLVPVSQNCDMQYVWS